jgi:hypothetical protein
MKLDSDGVALTSSGMPRLVGLMRGRDRLKQAGMIHTLLVLW